MRVAWNHDDYDDNDDKDKVAVIGLRVAGASTELLWCELIARVETFEIDSKVKLLAQKP